ncbi:MAG: hypothetical protein ACXW32_17710 [Limisphaerales bacterium]
MGTKHDPKFPYPTYGVSAKAKAPLLKFILDALKGAGCRIVEHTGPDNAPFQISFELASGERRGILAYAFLANTVRTKNRPSDEHRFQVKLGGRSENNLHHLWQDPFGLYTTLFLGINPNRGFFVAADPVLHSPTKFFISLEFKDEHVEKVLSKGWHAWERDRKLSSQDPVEIFVGGTPSSFLRYTEFEKEAVGESQGHRHLLAEKQRASASTHLLAAELALTEQEVLTVISEASRLKMAVRGWVAEEHLYRHLHGIPDISGLEKIRTEGGADISLQYKGKRILIECKNVLRKTTKAGEARLDFQRTRSSKSDPCSRYYSPNDFHLVAACMHAVTERWEFKFADTASLPHQTKKCSEKLANNITIDSLWEMDVVKVLEKVLQMGAKRR